MDNNTKYMIGIVIFWTVLVLLVGIKIGQNSTEIKTNLVLSEDEWYGTVSGEEDFTTNMPCKDVIIARKCILSDRYEFHCYTYGD